MDDYEAELERLKEKFRIEALKAKKKFLQQRTQKSHEPRVHSSANKTSGEETNSNNRPRLESEIEISGQTQKSLNHLPSPVKARGTHAVTPGTPNKSSRPNDVSMTPKPPRLEKYTTPRKNRGSSNTGHRSAKQPTGRPQASSATEESEGEFEAETPRTKDISTKRLDNSSFRTPDKSSRPNDVLMTPKLPRLEKYTTPTKKNRGSRSSNDGYKSAKKPTGGPQPSSTAGESEGESEAENTPRPKDSSSTERLDSSSFRRNLNIRMGVVGNEREKRERRRFVLDQCIRRDMNLRKNFNAYHYDERMFPAIRGITKAAPAAWNWDRSVVKDIICTLCFDRVRTMNRHAKEKAKKQGGVVRDGRARENQKRGHETESDKDIPSPKRRRADPRKFKSAERVQDSSDEDDLYAPPPKSTLRGRISAINPADSVPGSSAIVDAAPPYADPYKVKIGRRMVILSQSLNYSEFDKAIGQWLTVGDQEIRLYKPATGTGRDAEWKPLGHDVEYRKMIEQYSSVDIRITVKSQDEHFAEDAESPPESDFEDVSSTSLVKKPDTFIGGQNTTRSPEKGLLRVDNSPKTGKELSDPELLRNIENDDENLKLILRTPPNISNSNRKAANMYNERASQPASRINDVLTPGADFVSDTDLEELTSPKNRSQPTTPSTQRTHQSSNKRAGDQRKTPTSAKHLHIRAYSSKTSPKTLIGGITPTRTLFKDSRNETTYPAFDSLDHDPNDTVDWTSGGEKQLFLDEYLDHPKTPVGGITPTRTLFRNSRNETTYPAFGSLDHDPNDTADWTSGGEKQLFLDKHLDHLKTPVGGITPARTLVRNSRNEATYPTFGSLSHDPSDTVDWASRSENQLFLGECLDSEDNDSTDGTAQVSLRVQTLGKGLARVSAPKLRSRGQGSKAPNPNAPTRRPSLRASKTVAKKKITKTYKGGSSAAGGRGREKKQLKEEWAEFEKTNKPAYVNHKI